MRRSVFLLLTVPVLATVAGCVGLPHGHGDAPAPNADEKRATPDPDQEKGKKDEKGNGGKDADEKATPAKTIFEWAIGKKEASNGKSDNGEKSGQENGEKEKDKEIDTDRPDFGAATTTVGRGHAVLETGFTYSHDRRGGAVFTGHSYPDAVLRVGLFAEWFEFRIGQSFANFRTTPVGGQAGVGIVEPAAPHGAQDLYLGTKLALTEQKKFLPETVVVIQSTVPSGAKGLTAGQMLPGLIYLFSWDTLEDRLSLSGLIEADRAVDGAAHPYVQMAQTLEVKYAWTPRFKTFVEWVALYPTGATDSAVGPQYYIHPGVLFLVTKNLQLDAHVFIGLNAHATDFFGGPGLSIRY